MVLVAPRVAHQLDTQVVADAAAGESSAAEHTPLHGFELGATQVRRHAGSAKEDSGSTCARETHGEAESPPASLGLEELFLREKVAVWRLNDLVVRVILRVVVGPAALCVQACRQ